MVQLPTEIQHTFVVIQKLTLQILKKNIYWKSLNIHGTNNVRNNFRSCGHSFGQYLVIMTFHVIIILLISYFYLCWILHSLIVWKSTDQLTDSRNLLCCSSCPYWWCAVLCSFPSLNFRVSLHTQPELKLAERFQRMTLSYRFIKYVTLNAYYR